MSTSLEKAVEELFSPENARIGDVKFFRGHSPTVTAEQLFEQFKSANQQIEDGTARLVANVDSDE